MRSITLSLLLGALAPLFMVRVAVAQPADEPLDGDDPLYGDDQPAPAPAPKPEGLHVARVAEANAAPAASATAGTTDHDGTVGAWGFQVADAPAFAPLGAGVTLPMVGVRRWGSRDTGLEAGALFMFTQQGADPQPSTTAFGGTFGYLRAFGIYKHMSVFWEPQASLLVVVTNDGVAGTDDPTQMLLDGRFNLGTEVRLGFLGLPNLGMTAKLSAGLTLVNDGNSTNFFIGSEGGVASSVRGLLETSVGFVWYAP